MEACDLQDQPLTSCLTGEGEKVYCAEIFVTHLSGRLMADPQQWYSNGRSNRVFRFGR